MGSTVSAGHRADWSHLTACASLPLYKVSEFRGIGTFSLIGSSHRTRSRHDAHAPQQVAAYSSQPRFWLALTAR